MAVPKMLIMLPLIYFARKLDQNDEQLVFYLRSSFYTVQTLIFSTLIYLYFQVQAFLNSKEGKKQVYVAQPASPFADPNDTKKKYTQILLGAHMAQTLKSLIGSTLFGVAMQSGIHFYKGIITTLAIQSIMAPLNFIDNPLVKYFILGDTDAISTKTKEELTDDDEVVDAEGNPVRTKSSGSSSGATKELPAKKSFEEIMLDTWDLGQEAVIKPMMDAITKKNINFKTSENGWTPIMVISGLGVKETTDAMTKMKKLGADPKIVDGEGWNALHWSAFHGCIDGVKYLLSPSGFNSISIGLHTVKDKEGNTPLMLAETEKNDEVAKIIKQYISDSTESSNAQSDEGLRKRK